MFGIPESSIGETASALTIWSLPFSLITTFGVGYAFEILGRKWTIFLSFASTALIYIWIPFTAPSYTMLVVARCVIGVTMSAPISHPLIADYVHKKSQGKAVALLGVGVVAGEMFSMGILFNFTKDMDFRKAFAVAAAVIAVLAVFFLLTIKDPNFIKLRENIDTKSSECQSQQASGPRQDFDFQRLSLFEKIKKADSCILA